LEKLSTIVILISLQRYIYKYLFSYRYYERLVVADYDYYRKSVLVLGAFWSAENGAEDERE